MRSSTIVAVLSAVLVSAAFAQQADPKATAQTTVLTFLADGSVQPWDPSKGNVVQPPDEWRDQAKSVICLAGRNGFRDGYVVTNLTGENLLDFMSPYPVAPVPMTLLPVEEAKRTALAFAQRHLPELAAAGGEVICTADEKIAPYGAYLVTCQRVQKGVPVPTRALVGVRVYDGKIVRWRPEHTPLTADLTLKVNLEQAQKIASANVPGNTLEPVLWLESTPKVLVAPEGQQCVWDLWAELHAQNSGQPNVLEFLGHWQVDAGSGKVLKSEALPPTRELYFWYASKGGKHIPFPMGKPNPDEICRDLSPVPSPDGRRLLFCSYRPHEGYPQWMAYRPWSLFVVNRDGSDLRHLPAIEPYCSTWSPDGKTIGWIEKGNIILLDAASGQKTTLAYTYPLECVRYAWLPNGKIIATISRNKLAAGLHLLDPAQPKAASVELPKFLQPGEELSNLVVDSKGRAYLIVKTPPKPPVDNARIKNPYRLLALDPAQADANAEELLAYFAGYQSVQWMPDGKLLVQGVRLAPWVAVDLAEKTQQPWQPPRPLQPNRADELRVAAGELQGITWSEGEIFFAAQYFSGKNGDAPGQVIYACQPDGSRPRLVTEPDISVVAPLAAAK